MEDKVSNIYKSIYIYIYERVSMVQKMCGMKPHPSATTYNDEFFRLVYVVATNDGTIPGDV